MSISPAARAASRSAYRDVLRAASVTFSGDAPVLLAFRMKIRSDISHQSAVDEASSSKQTQFIREIADVLRKNIIQGERVGDPSAQEALYRIRLRKETELGDNTSIKNPTPSESNRRARRRDTGQSQTLVHTQVMRTLRGTLTSLSVDAAPAELDGSTSERATISPLHFSALKRAHKERVIPELLESDLDESFVRGSGPGGQSVNKTENNVQLLHKPTGIRVSCQDTRSLAQNRKIARKWLLEKLDKLVNPGLSKEQLKAAKQRERERHRKKKARKKAKKKLEKGEEDDQ